MKTEYIIKENSGFARIAAFILKGHSAAIVFGNVIHLYNISRSDFEKNERWLKHELCHIQQYRKYGFVGFLFRYLVESIKKGYYNNRFEVEARKAETDQNNHSTSPKL